MPPIECSYGGQWQPPIGPGEKKTFHFTNEIIVRGFKDGGSLTTQEPNGNTEKRILHPGEMYKEIDSNGEKVVFIGTRS